MFDFKNEGALILKPMDIDIGERILYQRFNGEDVIGAYRSGNIDIVFTDVRIFLVVHGLPGRKKDFTTLPYKKIQAYSIITDGDDDKNDEMDLLFNGLGIVKFIFSEKSNTKAIIDKLAQIVFK